MSRDSSSAPEDTLPNAFCAASEIVNSDRAVVGAGTTGKAKSRRRRSRASMSVVPGQEGPTTANTTTTTTAEDPSAVEWDKLNLGVEDEPLVVENRGRDKNKERKKKERRASKSKARSGEEQREERGGGANDVEEGHTSLLDSRIWLGGEGEGEAVGGQGEGRGGSPGLGEDLYAFGA